MAELTDKDVLTVLDRLDLETKQMQQARVVYAHIGDVIRSYQQAKQGLDSLAQKRTDLQSVISSLEGQIKTEEVSIRKRLSQERAELESEVESLKKRRIEAQEKSKKAEDKLKATEETMNGRLAELDAAIKAKTAGLETLTASFSRFTREHGLTAVAGG
jgi:DNA repair exonuclease SbcCD ATPase subunit